jgi:hypothetical protein
MSGQDFLREQLLRLLEEAYRKQAWHGPNLKGGLRGISPRAALVRPAPGRHNIAELVVHCAYWKYAVRRRLAGGKRGSFPLPGSNWFPRNDPYTERQWAEDRKLLEEQHAELLAAIGTLDFSRLTAKQLRLIRGAASHDLYHAGQVAILKRLPRSV